MFVLAIQGSRSALIEEAFLVRKSVRRISVVNQRLVISVGGGFPELMCVSKYTSAAAVPYRASRRDKMR